MKPTGRPLRAIIHCASRLGHAARASENAAVNAAAAPITWSRAERDAVLAQLAPYAGKAHWGFKDPRTIRLIEGYLEIFPEARLIAPFRHPLAVAQSLAARPGALSLSIDEGLALWRVTNAKLLDLARGHRVTLVRFSDTGLEDPLFSGPMRRFLAEIGLPEGWHGFYDGGLLHHSAGQEAAPPAEMALWDDLIACAQAQAQEPTLD